MALQLFLTPDAVKRLVRTEADGATLLAKMEGIQRSKPPCNMCGGYLHSANKGVLKPHQKPTQGTRGQYNRG
jgi:hypothetical protein